MFKFTIRELLLLTLVIGLTAGWWTDRARLVAREKQSADAAKKADMQTYALENVMQHMGLTTEWEHAGRRAVVRGEDGSVMYDWPAVYERPKTP